MGSSEDIRAWCAEPFDASSMKEADGVKPDEFKKGLLEEYDLTDSYNKFK